MHVFITGGRGVLGSVVGKKFEEAGHSVIYVDNYIIVDVWHPEKHLMFDISEHNKLVNVIRHGMRPPEPNIIIHLAEIASIDPALQLSAIQSNIAGTANVLSACALRQIKCFMGTWLNVKEATDLPTQSILWRKHLIPHYNKGNTVITEFSIPHLISVDLPSHSWGAIIRRVVNHFELGSPFTTDKSELFDQPIWWCTPKVVAETMLQFIDRRTRSIQIVGMRFGYFATISNTIGYLVDIYNKPHIVMSTPHDNPIIFKREQPKLQQDINFYNALKEEIDDFRERTTS